MSIEISYESFGANKKTEAKNFGFCLPLNEFNKKYFLINPQKIF